jgi:hypothetical protein
MRLSEWKVLKQLQTDDPVAQDMALKCITENDAWTEVLWQPTMALTPEEGFKAAAERVMKPHVYATLFDNVAKMGESVHCGFNWTVASLQVSDPVPGSCLPDHLYDVVSILSKSER